ncbi:MAG: cation:proton antiporter [Ruminococcaceae bacterium]|nr:cation:proton antiporter [Oscillospiraceae bacterium]
MINTVIEMRYEIASFILFAIGLICLITDKHLIKKIIGAGIMDSALFLYLAAGGYTAGRVAPILAAPGADPGKYISPVPSGLVLTGIVVSVSTLAALLALTYSLNKKYGTMMIDEIIEKAKQEVKDS